MRKSLTALALVSRLAVSLLHAGTVAESVIRLDDMTQELAHHVQETGEKRETQECRALVWVALNQPIATQG